MTDLPRMLDDIIVGLATGQPDLELMRPDDPSAWREAVPGLRPDVVILADPDEEDLTVCRQLLYEAPELRFLALGGGEDGAFLYALLPARVPLGDLSPEGLLHALRTPIAAEV